MKTHVYVIKQDYSPFIKIGISRNPKKRMASLQSANPYNLQLVYTILVSRGQAGSVELRLHNHFKACRERGEWFKASAHNVIEALRGYPDVLTIVEHPTQKVFSVEPEDEVKIDTPGQRTLRGVFLLAFVAHFFAASMLFGVATGKVELHVVEIVCYIVIALCSAILEIKLLEGDRKIGTSKSEVT